MFEPVFSRIRTIARNILPSVFADGNVTDMLADKLGRPVITPYQIRDLVVTASATLSTGTPTSLLAGSSDVFHDLMEITLANNSSVAATVALTNDGTTVRTFRVGDNKTEVIKFLVGLPSSSTGTIWELDMEDITGTTVEVGATFIKNR